MLVVHERQFYPAVKPELSFQRTCPQSGSGTNYLWFISSMRQWHKVTSQAVT